MLSQTANICAINDSLLKINFGKHWDGITIERIASPPYPKIGTKIIFVEGERKRSLARSESQGRKSHKVVRNSFPFSIPTQLYERLTRL